jgi:hypothetical protein
MPGYQLPQGRKQPVRVAQTQGLAWDRNDTLAGVVGADSFSPGTLPSTALPLPPSPIFRGGAAKEVPTPTALAIAMKATPIIPTVRIDISYRRRSAAELAGFICRSVLTIF